MPYEEISDKDKERVIAALTDIVKRGVCNACLLADAFSVSRDDVVMKMSDIFDFIYAMSKVGSWCEFNAKGALEELETGIGFERIEED